MLIFNTYNTLNLKDNIYSINKAYVWIHHYLPYQKILLPSNKTKMAKFALCSSLKQLPWQPDNQFLVEFML